jgi:hypothetical protein
MADPSQSAAFHAAVAAAAATAAKAAAHHSQQAAAGALPTGSVLVPLPVAEPGGPEFLRVSATGNVKQVRLGWCVCLCRS